MTPQEKYFLGSSLEQNCTAVDVQATCDAVGLLFPRTLKSIAKKIGNGGLDDLLRLCAPDTAMTAQTIGKNALKTTCFSSLQRRMMLKHFCIAQLTYNMGKCAGK